MSKSNETVLNEDILSAVRGEVRCQEDGIEEGHGIITSSKALAIAEQRGLDLVLIAPNAKPPVVKVMDYGKFRYQQEKKQKEARKNQKLIDIKEIKLSVKIAQNDVNYKIKHAIEFLKAGKHVKFRVFLKGREMANPSAGVEVLNRVKLMVDEYCDIDKEPKLEGRYVNMTAIPKK